MTYIPVTVFNYIIYFVQAVTFVTFTRKVLDSRCNSVVGNITYASGILLLFGAITGFNYLQYSVAGYIEIITFLIILLSYSFSCFKNNLMLKFSVPVFSYILYTGIQLFFYGFSNFILNVDWYNLLVYDTVYSIVAKLIINITFIFSLYIVYKFCNYSIHLTNISDYMFFVILPIIAYGVLILSFVISTDRTTSQQAMIALGVISTAITFISVVVMSLMLRAAQSNDMKTQNLIMKKEQEMYRERITEANKSLEEIAVIRHDMKNKVLCIGELLGSKNFEEAKQMCSEIKYELENATVLFHTSNPYLNSILNITYKKAKDKDIDIRITANCGFEGIGSADLVSMVGNLCDNAIEYLSSIDVDRKMEIKLIQKGSYYFISVKNNITCSVLENNPKLRSHKNDKIYHGHGIKNVRNISRRYKGSVDVSELNGDFIVTIMLEKPEPKS